MDYDAETLMYASDFHGFAIVCICCALQIRFADLMGPSLHAAAVERHLSQQEHAEQLQQVQSMWQMAAIMEFLHTFSLHLRLRGSFTPEELEVAIVSETAQTGLLANLHQVRQPNNHKKSVLGMPRNF